MKQKEIYLANLNPTKGVRPIVIISGNAMNDHLGCAIVCPLSSKIKGYAGCVYLQKNKHNKLTQNSEVITFQIRTIAKERLIKKIGEISREELMCIFANLKDILLY